MSSPDQEDSLRSETLPIYTNHRILYRVAKEGLWARYRSDGSLIYGGDYFTNRPRAKEIIKEEINRLEAGHLAKFTPPPLDLPPRDLLNSSVSRQLNSFVSHSVRTGLITPPIAHLISTATRGSDVNISLQQVPGVGGANLRRGSGQRPGVELLQGGIESHVRYFQSQARRLGLNLGLSDSDLVLLSAVTMAAHEWAHSIDRAFASRFLALADPIPELQPYKYRKNEFNITTDNLAQELIYREARQITSSLVPGLDPREESHIHAERFATALEYQAMDYQLTALGVSSDLSSQLIDSRIENDQEELNELLALRQQLGLSDDDLYFLSQDLRQVCLQNNLNPAYAPDLWTSAGYLASYTRSQLTDMITSAYSKLTPKDVTATILAYSRP